MLCTEKETSFKKGQKFLVNTLSGISSYPITIICVNDQEVIYYEDGYEYDKIKRNIEKDSVSGEESICIWKENGLECRIFPRENIAGHFEKNRQHYHF